MKKIFDGIIMETIRRFRRNRCHAHTPHSKMFEQGGHKNIIKPDHSRVYLRRRRNSRIIHSHGNKNLRFRGNREDGCNS